MLKKMLGLSPWDLNLPWSLGLLCAKRRAFLLDFRGTGYTLQMNSQSPNQFTWKTYLWTTLAVATVICGAHRISALSIPVRQTKVAQSELGDFIQNSILYANMERALYLNSMKKKGEGQFEAVLGMTDSIDLQYRDKLTQYLQQYARRGNNRVTQVTFRNEVWMSLEGLQGLLRRTLKLIDLMGGLFACAITFRFLSLLDGGHPGLSKKSKMRESVPQALLLSIQLGLRRLSNTIFSIENFKAEVALLDIEVKDSKFLWRNSIQEIERLKSQVGDLRSENTVLRTEMAEQMRLRGQLKKELSQQIQSKVRQKIHRNMDLV